MFSTDVVIVAGARTPMAGYAGAFKDTSGIELGATGTRLVLTLLGELRRRGLRYGLATACIGGGQGIAIVVEGPGG